MGTVGYCWLDVFLVAEVHFFRQPDIFLHGDAEVRHSRNFLFAVSLSLVIISVIDHELWHPHVLNVLSLVSNDVVEQQVQKHKQLDAHLLKNHSRHDEEL